MGPCNEPGGCSTCRADIGFAGALPLPHGSYCRSLTWSKNGERLLAGANTNALMVLKYPADDRYGVVVCQQKPMAFNVTHGRAVCVEGACLVNLAALVIACQHEHNPNVQCFKRYHSIPHSTERVIYR